VHAELAYTIAGMKQLTVLLLLCIGAAIGAGAVQYWHATSSAAVAQVDSHVTDEMASMRSEILRLRELVPSQSHAMADVSYQWSNLWFAGQQKNWPLATFYFNETRSHILWTIRIRPIRKDDAGKDVDLKAIFDGIDSSSFAAVKDAIAQKDSAKFSAAYKVALESCYSCHKTSSKPFLRPMIPQTPPQSIINYSADAQWPQ
jgi:hypothetical protein